MENRGVFDVFGRIVYRPALLESSADFYLFSEGNAITDALILVGNDTVPINDPSKGFYSLPLDIQIGDTVSYSLSSEEGEVDGFVVIPDTVQIIYPHDYDSLFFGEDFDVVWMQLDL